MREDSGFLPYSDSGPRAAGGHSAGSADGYRPSGPSRRRALMTHLAVAVLAAGAATGVTLGLDRPASPASAGTAAALPGGSADSGMFHRRSCRQSTLTRASVPFTTGMLSGRSPESTRPAR